MARPNDLVKTGSEFIGWNTATDGTGTSYSAGAPLTTATNLVLYAQWRAITYSFSYQLNGGTSAVPAPGTATFGTKINLPSAPSRADFTFAGWNDGGAQNISSGAEVTLNGNKIFVAQWTAQSFEISYDGNGHDSGASPATGSYLSLIHI